MFHDERQDALMKLAAMRGPALSIFVALLIAGNQLTHAELMDYTGYENQAVTKGLKKLQRFGTIVNYGRYQGWGLTPNWQQLPLPLLFIGSHDFHDSNHENHDSPHTRDLLTTTTTKYNDQIAAVVTREGKHENHDSPGVAPVDNSVRAWLIKGGIGDGSPQMMKILEMNHSSDFVKAHVLERLAQVKAGNKRFEVGKLIVRLKTPDAPPPMRCEECLKVERECRCHGQHIPEELRHIIKK